MWAVAVETAPVRAVLARAGVLEQRIMRMIGLPESELASTLRDVEAGGLSLDGLEITTCLRRGELEIATVFPPEAASAYAAFEAAVLERHGENVFSRDGATIDEIVAGLLLGPPVTTVAVAESCTGGLMAARLTDRGGSSAYVLGGVVVYSNEAKVDARRRAGRADRAVRRRLAGGGGRAGRRAPPRGFEADVGIGSPASPGRAGGRRRSRSAPSASAWPGPPATRIERTVRLPGDRAAVRERSTTVALHLLRHALLGGDAAEAG